MKWDVEAVKALVFTQKPVPDAAEIWQRIANSFPENAQKRGLQFPAVSVAYGPFGNFSLNVLMQVGRIEVSITALDPDPSGPSPTPVIRADQADAAIATIREIAVWLHKDTSPVRFAAATQLVKDVESEAAGVALLNEELGFELPSDSDSILFQLNRKRNVGGITINRLLKWGTARLSTLGVGIDNMGRVLPIAPEEEKVRAFMHVDVNNPPSLTAIPDEEAKKIVDILWGSEAELRNGGWSAL